MRSFGAQFKRKFCLSVLIFLIFWGIALSQEDWQQPLKYEVQVQAQLIPFFAVDKRGEPVFDLHQEEVRLYVDKSPRKIIEFKRYEFVGSREEPEPEKTVDFQVKPPERIIIFIMDTVFSSVSGIKRARKIALGIINLASPGDGFIVMKNDLFEGLRYIVGPTKDKAVLIKAIKKEVLASHLNFSEQSLRKKLVEAKKGMQNARITVEAELWRIMMEMRTMVQEKREDLKVFSYNLIQLKHVLKTITLPKIVFLFSEGVPVWVLGSREKQFYMNYLKQAAIAVNEGGSLLHLINSARIETQAMSPYSGKEGLRFMADTSGGKYFGGSKVENIVKQIKQSSAAYYELIFYPKTEEVKKFQIRIDCTRKGVKINTIKYLELDKPYERMELAQKKLFVLNVVNGGSWSRMSGKVRLAKFSRVEEGVKREESYHRIRVPLPMEIQNQDLDVYLVDIDSMTLKASFALSTQKATDFVELETHLTKNSNYYFVIIEPSRTFCLYNQIN